MKLAALQMCSGDDVAANIAAAEDYAGQAAANGAGIIVLPENFAALSTDDTLRVRIAEDDGDGPIQNRLAQMARRLKVWLVGGTIPLRSDDASRPFAACCVYDDRGERVARYDKIHLFDVSLPNSDESYRESKNTAAGTSSVTIATPFGRLGLAVCYDLRFPELFRQLAADGAELIALPAAFTWPTGRAHWRTLVAARAIENLCYVVAAAQTGTHPGGRRTYGHSMIVGPWGDELAAAGEETGIIDAPMDRDQLLALRRRFPVLSHQQL